MPISRDFLESNRLQTERLRRLVAHLDAKKLTLRLPNGWTISGALAHIGFWDRQRLCIMRRLADRTTFSGAYDGELFNEALQPFLAAIPRKEAASLAIQCAEEIDAFLSHVSDELISEALFRPDGPNLDRGSHRGYHLDQIENALVAAGLELK